MKKLLAIVFVLLLAACAGVAAKGKPYLFEPAYYDTKASPPCGIRGPQYTAPCIDDPTVEGAWRACPCAP